MKQIALIVLFVSAWLSTAASVVADTHTLTVSANVVGFCKFDSASSTLDFGDLDPSSGSDATALNETVAFWCTRGVNYSIGDDDGLHENGVANGNRMQHETNTAEYVPYTLSYTPTSGTGDGPQSAHVSMSISGTIANADYTNALAGAYADTVVLTISP